MRVVVCVKHVPDVESDRRFDGLRLDRTDDMVISEIDFNAVEAAVSLVEDHGGEVIALSMGPQDALDTVRRAIQVGADSGLLISDPALEGSDAPATARVLSAAIQKLSEQEPVDLVIMAMAALDGQTSIVPAAVATLLGWPQLTMAEQLEVAEDGLVTIERVLDDAVEHVRAPLPAVVSVTDEVNEPRMAGFKGIMAAKKADIPQWGLDDLGLDPQQVGATGSRSTVVSITRLPERERGVLVTDTGDGGERLAEYLMEHTLVAGLVTGSAAPAGGAR